MSRLFKLLKLTCLAACCLSLLHTVLRLLSPAQDLMSSLHWMDRIDLVLLDYDASFAASLTVFLFAFSGKRVLSVMGCVLAISFLMVDAISWALFFILGEFLNVDGFRFLIYNFSSLVLHIEQTSPARMILALFLLVIIPLLGIPLWLKLSGWIQKPCANPPGRRFWRPIIFVLAVNVLLFVIHPFDTKAVRSMVRNSFSPSLSLLSWYWSEPELPRNPKSFLKVSWQKRDALSEKPAVLTQKIPVIVIVVESLRSDVLEDGHLMPHAFELKQDSRYFTNAFTTSDETDYAWPAVLSSQYPLRSQKHYYYPVKIPFKRVFIYDWLKNSGYATAIFSAQNERWGNMINYLWTTGLDVFFDSSTEKQSRYFDALEPDFLKWQRKSGVEGKLDDELVMDRAIRWAGAHAYKNFFMAINLQRSHFPYTWPNQFTPPFSPYELHGDVVFTKYPLSQTAVMRNRYNNALFYIDRQIGKLVRFLKDKGLYDQSLIILTGDHGEAFNERGVSGHGNELYYEQSRVPLLVKWPGNLFTGPQNDFIQNLDIPLMICHILHLKPSLDFQGMDVWQQPATAHRPLLMMVATPRANQTAIILDGWKYINDDKQGKEFLFNLTKDPKEHFNLVGQYPQVAASLRAQLEQWRKTQLDYYQKSKFKNNYPPKFSSAGINL